MQFRRQLSAVVWSERYHGHCVNMFYTSRHISMTPKHPQLLTVMFFFHFSDFLLLS